VRPAIPKSLLVALHTALSAGCISTYQPMSGLHEPVAIDTEYANLDGLTLTVHCVPGGALDRAGAEDLCRKLTREFENQGATVRSHTGRGVADLDDDPAARATPSALTLRLSARTIHEEESNLLFWSWVRDFTFAQDITIRDETGFLLIQDTLIGRFDRRLGWTSTAKEDFTADFYRQLDQRALNARMRRQILREGRP
jgi:hypothetical protein